MENNYIVCIGASAGGLEALETFFINMSFDSNLSFVVIQHLSPDYKSLMPELLSKKTNMPVIQVNKDTLVKKNHVYLIPPGNNLKIQNEKLYLSPKDSRALLNLPIDIFMKSLAEDQGDKAIGIILSGTGSDGMQGVRAIKEAGGMVIVQDRETAKFDGMPKSAISTGLVDFVLAPEDMPEHLIAYLNHPLMTKQQEVNHILSDEDNLAKIFTILHKKKNIDFSYYKRSTLMRRIQRRLSVNHIKDLSEYVQLLENSDNEVNILQREFLIGVTNFFRDKEVFAKLESKYIPDLVKRKTNGDIRIWIAGCSSGEEAYSIAILVIEEIEKQKVHIPLKIFATDIDDNAVFRASQGVYPESIIADIDPRLLSKYFQKRNDSYLVSRKVRESVIFAQHNLLNDPPFTNIDFISCRNLLIYLQGNLQQKVMDFFSFSLNNNGILLLGKSESVGKMSSNFQQLHPQFKIYNFMGNKRSSILNKIENKFNINYSGPRHFTSISTHGMKSFEENRVLDRYLQTVHGVYLPTSVIVNENNEILHSIGDTGNYLNIPPGKLLNDITKLVHRELAVPIATGLQKLFKLNEIIRYTNISITKEGKPQKLNLLLKPIAEKRGQQNIAAIFFEPIEERISDSVEHTKHNYNMDQEAKQRISDLEQELQFSRENLQATIEELETSNEELQATNEELLSSNEELQSTNEELQSVNEELYTVNSEYQEKISELTELNNDMTNLVDSLGVATIFLDENLDIRKMTPEIENIFNVKLDALGDSIIRYDHYIKDINLLEIIKSVMVNDIEFEKTVKTTDGEYYLMKVKPYKIAYKVYAGALLTFVNITNSIEVNEDLQKSTKWLDMISEVSHMGGWEIDVETGKTKWTEEVYKIHEVDFDFDHNVDNGIEFYHPKDKAQLELAVRKCMDDGTPFDLQCEFISAKGNHKVVRSMGKGEFLNNKLVRVYGTFQDVTDQVENADQLADSQKIKDELVNIIKPGIIIYKVVNGGNDFIINEMNDSARKMAKCDDSCLGAEVREAFPGVVEFGLYDIMKEVYKTGKTKNLSQKEYKDKNIQASFENTVIKIAGDNLCVIFENVD